MTNPPKFELPTWEQCNNAYEVEVDGELERFIRDNEPLDEDAAAAWRSQLHEIICTAIRGDYGTA